MYKLCMKIRELNSAYAQTLGNVADPYASIFRFIRLNKRHPTKNVKLRNCILVASTSDQYKLRTVYVTAPPNNENYQPLNNRILIVLCPGKSNICELAFSIIINDFERKYPESSKSVRMYIIYRLEFSQFTCG